MDVFSVPWVQDKLYLFPPFNLIGRALTKIEIETIEFACLIHSSSLASTGLVPTVSEVAGKGSNHSSCETGSTPESRSDSTSSTGGGMNVPSRMTYLR